METLKQADMTNNQYKKRQEQIQSIKKYCFESYLKNRNSKLEYRAEEVFMRIWDDTYPLVGYTTPEEVIANFLNSKKQNYIYLDHIYLFFDRFFMQCFLYDCPEAYKRSSHYYEFLERIGNIEPA